MNLSAPFIQRPVMTTFLMLALLIMGIVSFRNLPVSDLPNMERPRIGVSAYYTGAPPDTMVNTVTMPLEKELMNVKGIKELVSRTSLGSTSIDLDFEYGKNMEEASRDVQTALNRAERHLPSDIDSRPLYHKKEANNHHIMYLVLTSPSAGVAELREYSDLYIQPRLSRIEGVASIDAFGAPYSLKIKLNPDRMASRRVTLDQVLSAIKQHNADVPLGTIKTGTRMLTIELPSRLQNAKDFNSLIVAPGPIYLKDIGIAVDERDSDQEFHFGTKDKNTLAMIIGIKKLSGANTTAISKDVQKILESIKKDLPPSMQLNLWFDRAVWIHESIHDVEFTLLVAFALVVLVIFLSLGRLSEALIPSIALPMSLVGTFIVMHALNYSLDILSLLALTLSVGFVVDDAIVVLENIVRHNEKGLPPREASLRGSKEICFTVLSMTLSLVAVFIPLLFMKGAQGMLFREFSVTLAAAVLVSGFISLTLTPMLCSRFLTKHSTPSKLQKIVHDMNERIVSKYAVSLRWCVRHPKSILTFAAVCFCLTVALFQSLTVNLFPEEDRGFAWAVVNLTHGTPNSRALEYQRSIEKLLQSNPSIESFVDLNNTDSLMFLLRLVPAAQRPPQAVVLKEIQEKINAIPGTQTFAIGVQLINMNKDVVGGGSYQFLLRGMDLAEVEKGAEAMKAAMQKMPEFPYVDVNLNNDDPKLVVQIHEEQARKVGVTKKEIQTLLQQAYAGGRAGQIRKGSSQYDIFVELEKEFRNSPDSLAKLYITTSKGSLVPLKSLASWHEKLGAPTLNRVDQLPALTMQFSLNKDISLIEGLNTVEDLAKKTLPPSVTGKLQGSAAMAASTLQDSAWLILAAVLVMYVVLGVLYESFIHPLTILSSLPFACLGGVLTLLLFNEPLSLFSLVGFLLLLGIVKKNGIMMVDYALEAQKNHGLTAEQAVVEGSLVRFRPIMMTTIAAIMGALPIAVGYGDGSELRRGLGLVITGGLIFSQMLTLYVTPVIYLVLERLRQRFHKPKLLVQPQG